jgi:hypothetical protein
MDTVLSVLVLTAISLLAGAIYLWTRQGARRQAVLMLVLVGVIAANIAILAVPMGDGAPPAANAPQ